MKTIIVSVFALSVSLQVPAQSDWESPAMRQTQTQEKSAKMRMTKIGSMPFRSTTQEKGLFPKKTVRWCSMKF